MTPRSVNLYCAETDSAQYNTAWSQAIFLDFRKLQFPGLLGSMYVMIFRKYFENQQMANIA